jgi:type IV pilus assembly protein PilX
MDKHLAMKISIQSAPSPTPRKISPHSRWPHSRLAQSQRGVALFIALIVLVVISLLAATSIRNASTTVGVSGNVRTTELATQAAEIALQHCELAVLSIVREDSGTTDSYDRGGVTLPTSTATSSWGDMDEWDASSSAKVFQIPLTMVNQTGMGATYKRPPECMVERLIVTTVELEDPDADPLTYKAVQDTDSKFLITARGFGPEVAKGTGRPVGSEVWLQSHIEIAAL